MQIVGMRVHVCVCVCVCVCLRPRLLITSGMMWRDMNFIRLVKQVLEMLYGNYMPLLLMDVVLALLRVMETKQIKVSQHCIRH